jgi:uncharacterized protein
MTQTLHETQPVIVDTARSPHASLKPVPLDAVTLTNGFWAPWRDRVRQHTLRAQYELLESTGRLANFRRAAGKGEGEFQGLFFNDSDVYKWLEAASWALATGEDAELTKMVNATIDLVTAAQETDGYLNTYYMFERTAERWSNLRDQHELYCAGHLFQAAVAHYRATGQSSLLDVARRFADLICETFGSGDTQRPGVAGHPEIEMALVELARATSERRYLEQAAYFVDARGHGIIGGLHYHQDHAPLREVERLAGHAVRAVYLTAGATDLYAETGDPALGEALLRLWQRMVQRQMYITGGLGPRYTGEAFGADYELPNARAYAETCAGIANLMWAWRMLQLDGGTEYADVMERALYNAALPGFGLDAESYFYVNPLATDGMPEPGRSLGGRGEIYRRQPWFTCACCPPNVARLLTQLPGYLYSTSDDASAGPTLWVHHFASNEASITLPDGRAVQVIQRTRYPWNGQVILEILTPGDYTLRIRIPGWCRAEEERDRPTASVNSGPCPGEVLPGRYLTLQRTWEVGDSVCITLPMPVRRIAAHPYVLENAGRVALMRGPLLYCLEQTDHPGIDLRDVILPDESELTHTFRRDLLGGVEVIEGEGLHAPPDSAWRDALYRDAAEATPTASEPVKLIAIPYYAWANREVGAMQVWLRRT